VCDDRRLREIAEVTPGDFNERIGVHFGTSSRDASSDLQFQLDSPPFTSSSVHLREGDEEGDGDCLSGILKNLTALTSLISCIPDEVLQFDNAHHRL
jgi:hypothetical protein